jgi:hypothetical protein
VDGAARCHVLGRIVQEIGENLRQLRVPAHDGRDSDLMADTIPAAWRTVFRPEGGHFGVWSGKLSAMISER